MLSFSHIRISSMAQTKWFVDIVFQRCALGSCVSSFFGMADVFTRWVTRSVSLLRVSQGLFLHDVGQASLFGLQAASGSIGLEKRAWAQAAQNRDFEPNAPQIQKLERSDKNMPKTVAYAVIFRGAQQFQAQKQKRCKTARINNKYPVLQKCPNTRNHTKMRKVQNLEKSRLRKFENSGISLWFCRFASAQ